MNQIQKTFEDIDVEDIFHNCLTVGQRKEMYKIVDNLVHTRDLIRNSGESEIRPIYTCNEVCQDIYEEFIAIAIRRTSAFKEYVGSMKFDLLKVDLCSSYQSDNQLRLMVLEKLIAMIQIEQAGWENINE